MDKFEYSLLFFSLYIVGLAWVAWQSRYHDHGTGFIIGNRRVGFWGIYGSIVSYLRSGSAFVFWFMFVAMMGFGSLWILAFYFIPFIIMALLAPQAQRLSNAHNYVTLPDLMKDRQGPLMASALNLLALYTSIIGTAAQLFVAGNIIDGLLGTGVMAGTLIGMTIVCAYTLLGGFLSVVRTDIYQALILIILALGALAFGDWPALPEIVTELTTPDWNFVTAISLMGLTIPASADLWQRYFSAKTPQTARNGTLAALATDFVLVSGIILFITNILATAPDTDPQQVFNSFFSQSLAHPAVIALFGVFIISAMLSTLDNQAFNFSSIVAKNVMNMNIAENRDRFIRVLRIVTIIMLASVTALSLTIENLLQWLLNTYAFVGVITPFIFYAVIKKSTEKHSDKLLAAGFLTGTLIYWGLFAMGLYNNMYWYAAPYSAPLLFIVTDLLINRRLALRAPA